MSLCCVIYVCHVIFLSMCHIIVLSHMCHVIELSDVCHTYHCVELRV